MPYQLGSAPPGLRGFLLSRQNQAAEGEQALRAAQLQMGLQGLLQKQQMAPLEMELLKAKINEKKGITDLLGQYNAGQTPTNGASASDPMGELGMINRIATIDPQRGRAMLEVWKTRNPEIKFENGIPVHPRQGPLTNMQTIPHTVSGEGTRTPVFNPNTKQWEVAATPGASDLYQQRQRIGEQEKARYDVMTVPPTSPGAPPTFDTRLNVAGGQPQQQVHPMLAASKDFQNASPEDKAAIAQVFAAQQQGMGATVQPQPGVRAAGMSPLQKADVAGRERFKETAGSETAKLAAGLTDSAQKAENQLATLDAIRVAVNEIKAAGGATGAYQPMIKRATELVQGLGVDPKSLGLPSDAGPYQVLDALTNKMALGLIGVPGGMPANLFSEADRKFVQASVARPVDTEQGLNAKLEMFEKMNKRQIEQEQSWLQAQEQGRSFNQWRMDWAKHVRENKLFNPDDTKRLIESTRPRGKAGLTPQEQAELDSLRKRFNRR